MLVGPDYKTPPLQVPAGFANQAQAGLSTDTVETAWWRGFRDDRLNQVVELALANNHDVRVATARIREAQALRSETTFDRYPTVTAQGSFTRERVSDVQALPGSDRDIELYDAGFDASWELDFFGRVRRSIEASAADVGAAEANRRDMLVSLLAEVARNYFALRGTQSRLAVARQRYQFGVADFLTVLVAERTPLEAQDRLADSETRTATPLVAVYKALGGGWEIAPEMAYSKAP